MPLVFRSYACSGPPDAELYVPEHVFELLQDSAEGPPNFCPKCGTPCDPEAEPVPTKIAIGGSKAARSVDMTYKLVEQSSLERAQMAEEAGLSPAEARA